MTTFNVSRVGKRKGDFLSHKYILTISALPGRKWKYDYYEMQRELMVVADLSSPEARNILMDAYVDGEKKWSLWW